MRLRRPSLQVCYRVTGALIPAEFSQRNADGETTQRNVGDWWKYLIAPDMLSGIQLTVRAMPFAVSVVPKSATLLQVPCSECGILIGLAGIFGCCPPRPLDDNYERRFRIVTISACRRLIPLFTRSALAILAIAIMGGVTSVVARADDILTITEVNDTLLTAAWGSVPLPVTLLTDDEWVISLSSVASQFNGYSAQWAEADGTANVNKIILLPRLLIGVQSDSAPSPGPVYANGSTCSECFAVMDAYGSVSPVDVIFIDDGDSPVPTPEPAALTELGLGVAGMVLTRRRLRRR